MPYDYSEYFEGYGMLEVLSSGAVAMLRPFKSLE
jgi:hypothetical protein